MCTSNITPVFVARLNAEDRDALREFASKRAAVAIDCEHVKFWQSVVAACTHPKEDVPVTGEVG